MISLFLIIMGWLGGESGQTWPWSAKWQSKLSKYKANRWPEWATATLLSLISYKGYLNLGLDIKLVYDSLYRCRFVCLGLSIYNKN